MRKTEAPELIKELGENFDFDGNGVLFRILDDERFDEYIESVFEWEKNEKLEK